MTLVGGSWVGTGQYGGAIDLQPNGQRVEMGNLDVAGNALTIMMWLNADDFGISDARLIAKVTGTAEQDHYWMLSTINSGGTKLRFRLKTDVGGTDTLIANSGNLSTGAQMKLYVDGVEVGNRTKTGALSTNADVAAWIGASPSNNKWFDGRVDEIKIYDRALTGAEIITEMNAPVQ